MSGEGNPAYNGGTCRNYHKNVLLKSGKARRCIWCSTMDDLQVHHIDHDKHNGNADNLDWLCGPCNRMEAQIHALVEAGRATMKIENGELTITFLGIGGK